MGFLWAFAIALGVLSGQSDQVADCEKSSDGAKIKVIRIGGGEPGSPTESKGCEKIKVIRIGGGETAACATSANCAKACVCCAPGGQGKRVAIFRGPGGACATGDDQRCVVTVQAAPGMAGSRPPFVLVANAFAFGDDDEKLVMIQEPRQWIGVLLSPVPEPLAAHVGPDGMMIVNVVEDSPADKAGLEQYDVILAFAGQKIDDMEDLSSAIGDAEIGEKVKMAVIRDGKRRKLAIAPARRMASGEWEYKYEVLPEATVDQSFNLRGHRLHMVPGGTWQLEDLGQLHGIPEILEKLEGMEGLEGLNLDLRGLNLDLDDLGAKFDFDVKVLDELPSGFEWNCDDGARVEIRIQLDDDGNVTTIRRDADGKIHVERTDADGNESSDTYDDAAEFEKDDPEGCKLYRRHSGSGSHGLYHVRPPAGHLGKAREHYQIAVEKRLQDAVKRSQETQKRAQGAAKTARKHYEKLIKKQARRGADATGKTLSVQIDNDGAIRVTVGQDGQRTIYEFDSKASFKTSEPELYERVKSLFE